MAKKKKKKKKEEFEPMAFPAPEARDFGKEFGEVSKAAGKLGQTQADIDIETQRRLAEQNWAFMVQKYPEMQNYMRQDAALSRELQEAERQATRGFIRDTGPAMWQEAQRTQPELGQAVRNISKGLAGSEFTRTLDKQVMDELKLGGALTPEAERMAQQTARQAYSARGQVMGDSASVAEVLSRDEMSRARLRERQGLGMQREQQEGVDRQFAMSSAALLDQLNPAYKVLGLQTTTNIPALGTSTSLTGFQGNAASSGGIMSATLGYGSDLYSSNQNMSTDLFLNYQNALAQIDASKRTSAAQLQAAGIQASATTGAARTSASGAMMGAGIGAAGAIIGGVAIAF